MNASRRTLTTTGTATPVRRAAIVIAGLCTLALAQESRPSPAVTFADLLAQMTNLEDVARVPSPAFTQQQASSYNRESKVRGGPGWFADSDGTGFIREEAHGARSEWVAMEHEGPGCLTRLWAPYFYYDFGDRVGPRVRIYLDGSPDPTIDANWIELLTNDAWPDSHGPAPKPTNGFSIPAPLARFTARAGDVYLPIPFARSCKVTFDKKPFYNIVNWRAYGPGTSVETFTRDKLHDASVATCAAELERVPPQPMPDADLVAIAPEATLPIAKLLGANAIRELRLRLGPQEVRARPSILRTLVLTGTFDGETTIWCPIGDLFGSPNAINPFTTRRRWVSEDGSFVLRWPMPFARSCELRIVNLGTTAARVSAKATTMPWTFDDRSLHLHVTWNPDAIERGDHFEDMTLLSARGTGVLVGDQLTVLNHTRGWWGEGDEKIYVDSAYDRGFPDHFGTGTEDYYGWAGGVNPTWADTFSHPFLANIAVGSGTRARVRERTGDTRGFNICTRERGLDAVPFRERLVFDMEASPGVDQRTKDDRLGYSSVVFWYGRPGATCERGADPAAARAPLMR